MTTTRTIAHEAYEQMTIGLISARDVASERGLDPDRCVTFMTTSMLALIRSAQVDFGRPANYLGFCGHAVVFLPGPETRGFSAHPRLL